MDFWKHFGLKEQDRSRCLEAVRERYAGWEVREYEEQGGCSFTMLVSRCRDTDGDTSVTDSENGDAAEEPNAGGTSCIVQVRPAQHALDLDIAAAAKQMYPALAPRTRALNHDLPGSLCAYEIQKMPGTPLSRLLPKTQVLDAVMQQKHKRLITSLASLIAASYAPPKLPRHTRADSPMSDTPTLLSQCRGRVGSSMVRRLEQLSQELPSIGLRHVARDTWAKLRDIRDYPVVLNHGDLIPSNILVDEESWEITGLVDWAEAELLPFGTCAYGLELVLGHVEPIPSGNEYVYFDNAVHLRDVFWTSLFAAVPDLKKRRADVETMRDVGVLLWYGFAWDEGRVDRVVSEGRDGVEVACLRAFMRVG
jgi:hypothetical protein